jgi:hypothetical protein
MSASAGGRGEGANRAGLGGTSARLELPDPTVNVRRAPDPVAPGHSLVDPLVALAAGTATAAVTSSAVDSRLATCGRPVVLTPGKAARASAGPSGCTCSALARTTRTSVPRSNRQDLWTIAPWEPEESSNPQVLGSKPSGRTALSSSLLHRGGGSRGRVNQRDNVCASPPRPASAWEAPRGRRRSIDLAPSQGLRSGRERRCARGATCQEDAGLPWLERDGVRRRVGARVGAKHQFAGE